MKQVFIAALITLFGCSAVFAQDKKLPPLDSSPMDMAYYPVMYPYVVKVKGEPGALVARVIYSRPQKKGRKIFGDLEPYGELYRLGPLNILIRARVIANSQFVGMPRNPGVQIFDM